MNKKKPDLSKITTQHKERDLKICDLWGKDLVPVKNLAKQYKLSKSRIRHILYANRDYLKPNLAWERTKSLQWLKRQKKLRKDTVKDSLEVQDRITPLIKEDKALIDNSIHITLTKEEKVERGNRLQNIFADRI